MSLYSDALAAAADTQDIQGGGPGFIADLSNNLTAGAAGAVISGLGSIYNTAAAGVNALGGSMEEIDTYKKLQEIDLNWAEFYKRNETPIDVVGFIGTSFIPGTLAIKGLNAVRAGAAGNAFGRALGFAKTRQAEALDAAVKELAIEGGTIFTRINKNKMAAMGWGFADQNLTAAAFETGVALTMKQSPLLADDSWWDIAKTAMVGSAFGGVIGGGIDSIILQRGFKDAVKGIDAKLMDYNYQQVLSPFNIAGGDKAAGIIDSLLRVPEETAMNQIMKLPESISSRMTDKRGLFDISALTANAKSSLEKKAIQDFEIAIRAIAPDSEVGSSAARFILEQFTKLKAAGAPNSVIAERMGDYLYELKALTPATAKLPTPATDLWYFSKAITVPREQIKTIDDWKNAFVSNTPWEAGSNAYNKPYVFVGNQSDMERVFENAALIGRDGPDGFPTLAAAWKAGRDVAFNPDRTVRVNDSSRYWKRVDDPVYNSNRYLNTRTGAITEDAVLTAADRLPSGTTLDKNNIKIDAVYLPVKVGNNITQKIISMKEFRPDGDVEYFTARHAWASRLTDQQLPTRIDSRDFSLMDRLRSVTDPAVLERIEIGTIVSKPGSIIETRGKSARFHGSSNKVSVEDFTYDNAFSGSADNIYGAGMYTTDAADIAIGYTKKGKGKDPSLYHVAEKVKTKIYDLERSVDDDLRAELNKLTDDAGFPDLEYRSLKQWHDEVRAESANAGLSKSDVQELFFAVRTQLEEKGYHGYFHKGGDKTGNKAHDVKIYWDPQTALQIDPVSVSKLRTPATEEFEAIGTAAEISIPSAIKSAKLSAAQDAFAAAYSANTTLDVRELAYRLNTDAQWLEGAVANKFRQSLSGEMVVGQKVIDNTDGLSRPLTDYLQRETVIAEYARPQQFKELQTITPEMTWQQKRQAIMDQVANNGGQFVTGELAWHYRVQTAIAATKTAAAAVLGSERVSKLLDLAQDAAKLADSAGVGASFLASSNASYGELLKLWSQNTGKNVHLWINEDLRDLVDTFSTVSTRLRADAAGSAELGIVTNLLRGTDEKYIWVEGKQQMMLRELKGLTGEKLQETIEAATSAGRKVFIDIESPVAYEFLKTHHGVNAERVGKRQVLTNARGLTSNFDGETVYVPPIDTTYFKHFAFVRPIEGKAFGTSETAMIFGRDAAELSRRAAIVDKQNFEVITKDQTEKFFKAKGHYDFDQTINEPRINSELRKSGVLNNMFPEVRSENLIEDYIRWHQNQTSRLVRDAVETNYAQQVQELRKLGESYVEIATSKFSGTLRSSKSEIANPYDDYVKTALDVSKRSEYTFFHQANEFVDALGTRAYQAAQSAFGDARKGVINWQEANAIAEKHGIKGMYSSEADFFTSNVPRDRNLVKEYVAKANSLLANFVLRFDFANSILNVVSTPLMLGTEMASIRNLIKNDPALIGKLSELTSVAVPGGGGKAVPSTTRLVTQAVNNFFGVNKQELLTRYRANGDIKEVMSQYHSMLDDLAMRADFKTFSDGVDKAFEKVAGVTGNNWAEQFTRFVSADVMRQLTEPLVETGKLTLKEQNAYISVFVNRVQGNYISSQRPIVFQGVLGSAVGLFQTYSFNLLQQLLRHVANKDKRAIATMYGMQAGLFGLNGTPLFEAVNTHIIGNAAVNDGHFDAYSLAPAVFGKELGDWMMYGTASAFPAFGDKWPSLYSRGDINPRHVSILPLNPKDVPAIDASIRVVANVMDVGSKLAGGAAIGQTLLQGLEHNGVNRPLAGFAQVLAQQSTTSRAGLISASSDFSLIATASRIAGSRPMDESIALNALYRNKAYDAADRDRMEILGERVKTYLYKNQFPPDEVMDGFMKDYAAAGGRVENFNRTLQTWAKDANRSTVEKMRSKLNSSTGQRLNELMGGEGLDDYRNHQGQSEMLTPE